MGYFLPLQSLSAVWDRGKQKYYRKMIQPGQSHDILKAKNSKSYTKTIVKATST